MGSRRKGAARGHVSVDRTPESNSPSTTASLSRPAENSCVIGRIILREAAFDPVDAEGALLDALCNRWPLGFRVKFLITPGGFVLLPFPGAWSGGVGWDSTAADLRDLIPHAQEALSRVMTDRVYDAATGKTQVITVGIDLRSEEALEAELVAVCDTASRRVFWTGKSYPVPSQETALVQVADLETHLLPLARERVLVLGCHDLNMFSPRARANQSPSGVRRRRCDQMRRLARQFDPTVVLQHPHNTDTPNIWRVPWAGIRECLPTVRSWASGICYANYGDPPRAPLQEVLEGTAGGTPWVDLDMTAPPGPTQRQVSRSDEPGPVGKPEAFVTYENVRNPHVTIHRQGCHQIKKHGGQHKYKQGRYQHHARYRLAVEYANRTGLPRVLCSFCRPAEAQ